MTMDEQLREELVQLTGSLCKAVSDPKRLMLLHLLGERPHAVGELADRIEATQANTSQHLAVLREQGLVDTERQGASIIYSLRYPSVLDAVSTLRDIQSEELMRRAELVRGRTQQH